MPNPTVRLIQSLALSAQVILIACALAFSREMPDGALVLLIAASCWCFGVNLGCCLAGKRIGGDR